MIKDILKKIIPVTYHKIEREHKTCLSELENKSEVSLQKLTENVKESLVDTETKLQRTLRDSISRMKDVIWKLDHNFPQIKNELNQIQESVDRCSELLEEIPGQYKYNNNYERKVISSFYEIYEKPDFKEKFFKLIDGLDSEYIDEVVKILQRQRLIKDTMNQEIDLFTVEEQQQILKIDKELKQQIFRISDDIYCYKHYFLPIPHFEASVFLYKHGINCIEHPEILKDKDILDVGGYIGDSILVLKELTDQKIYSFEATSENFALMQKTIELNQLDNVVLECMALGSEQGTLSMDLAGSSSAFRGNGIVKKIGTETVHVNTLDSYMENKEINVGLIKVDIEGAEQDFMKGAKKTIEKYKPVLLMSIYHNADDFFSIKPILESWNLGYKFKIYKPIDYSVSREVLLIAEIR